jgi:hypothetical protein
MNDSVIFYIKKDRIYRAVDFEQPLHTEMKKLKSEGKFFHEEVRLMEKKNCINK